MSQVATMIRILVLILLAANLHAAPHDPPRLRRDNGAIAHAHPLQGILVDGKLDEWPDHLPRHSIAIPHFGHEPKDAKDFEAWFRVAYDEATQRLFFAVEVEDDAHLTNDPKRPWWDDDSCIIYLDPTHSPRGSGAAAWAAAGELRKMPGPSSVPWDPAVAAASWKGVNAALRRVGTRTNYEWSFVIPGGITAGKVLGFDIVVTDLDTEDRSHEGSYLSWGPHRFKGRRSGRTGDLVLSDPKLVCGTLKGSLHWPKARPGPRIDTVRILAAEAEEGTPWYTTALDEKGHFEISLPPGSYRIEASRRLYSLAPDLLRISDDSSTTATVHPKRVTRTPPLVLTVEQPPKLAGPRGVLFEGNSDQTERITRFMQEMMHHYQVPGAQLALVREGRIIYDRSFGVTNAYTRTPVTKTTLFEAASITKMVFAFAVLRLVERKEFDLDAPLLDLLAFPALEHDLRARKLNARHVLTHRSGLPNWASSEKITLAFTPGTAYGYSGEAFEFLARAVSHVTKRPIEDILLKDALLPMGLATNTHFADSPLVRSGAAHGHRLSGITLSRFPRKVGVAHSMLTTAGSLASFMIGLHERKGLKSTTYDELLKIHTRRPANEIATRQTWRKGFGLGFMLMESPTGLVFGHDGNNGDFRANFEAYENLRSGYVLMTNGSLGGVLSNALREFLITGSRD